MSPTLVDLPKSSARSATSMAGVLGSFAVLIACGPHAPPDPEDIELVYSRWHGIRGDELRGAVVGRPDVPLIERQPEHVNVLPESWSHEGSLLAVSVGDDVWLLAPGSHDPRVLSSASAPLWSPTKMELVFVRGAAIRLLDADTNAERVLTTESVQPCSWSPEGDRLALLSGEGTSARVGIVDVASGNVISSFDPDPTGDMREAECPRWSPTDEQLVFVARGPGPFGEDVYSSIYAIRADGTDFRGLNPGYSAQGVSDPILAPDGSEFAVAGWAGDAIVPSDHVVLVCAVVSEGCVVAEGSARGIAFAADGRRAVSRFVDDSLDDARVFVEDDGTTWRSAGDGRFADGVPLWRPLGR